MMLCLLFGLPLLAFFLLWLGEKQRNSRLEKDLAYITEKLEELRREDGRAYLRLPSDEEAVRRLAAGINRVLASFYGREAEAARFQQDRKQMLTNVSHDLKTPLTVLNGYTEILLQKSGSGGVPEQLQQLIRKLSGKTADTVRLVNQFFDLARLSSHDMPLQPERTDTGRLCREILLEYYDVLEAARFTIRAPETPEPVYAMADEEAFKRILKNLIDNAVKYGSDGHYLGVSVTDSGRQVSVGVTDHGKGFDRREQERIFLRAYREGRGIGRHVSGSGLGLAISKGLAEQMGGALTAASDPGRETVFTLTLPKS